MDEAIRDGTPLIFRLEAYRIIGADAIPSVSAPLRGE